MVQQEKATKTERDGGGGGWNLEGETPEKILYKFKWSKTIGKRNSHGCYVI